MSESGHTKGHFPCAYCNRMFTTERGLNAHCDAKHGGGLVPLLTEALQDIVQFADVAKPHEMEWLVGQIKITAGDAISKATGGADG